MEEQNIDKLLAKALNGDPKEISTAMAVLMNGRLMPLPPIGQYTSALNPWKHDIMDTKKRPDKLVNVDPTSDDYGVTRPLYTDQEEKVSEKTRIEKVARIALAFQKLIVKRSVGITFGNPVKYKASPENEQEKTLYNAIIRVLKDNKEQTHNRRVARQLYGVTEVAERWYVTDVKDEHTNYSKNATKKKIRVVTFSPQYGDVLYPFFDDNRDMVAFSRRFTRKNIEGKDQTFFETLTSDMFYMWYNDGDVDGANSESWKMVEGYPMPNPYGKIPVIYGCIEKPDYDDVQSLINRLEVLLSNFADTNDYHASPKIVVKGNVTSFCKKGEAGAVLEVDQDADVNYLAWQQAPDAVKMEYQTLKELIHTLTQTPDISWESVKGLNVSGVALQLMFMDAILKVKDNEEVWLDYLTRRINLLMAILSKIDVNEFDEAAKSLFVEPEIQPYIIIDEKERADIELSLSGNKQLKSRRSAMQSLGVDNIDEEIKVIEEEEAAEQMFDQNEPTLA